MRRLGLLVWLAIGCAAPDPAAGCEISSLPIGEADAARAALEQADLVLRTAEAPPRTFFGSAGVVPEFGADGHHVSLSLFASGLIDIAIPNDRAATLASTGWDFTIGDDGTTIGTAEADVRGLVTGLQIRADPDGLFFATLHVRSPTGATQTLIATGRLTGICTVDTGGSPTAPDDVAACNAIIGALRPATERPPLGPTR